LTWDDKQHQIAKKALELFSEGIKIEWQGQQFAIHGVSVIWKLECFQRSLAYLTDITGPDRDIDPFERPDSTSWVIVSQVLSLLGQRLLALDVVLRYLKVCYGLQEQHRRRMHKGAPLFWVSQRHRDVGQNDLASSYMLLAFIEDCKAFPDPHEAPAYIYLINVFHFPTDFLDQLITYAKEQETFPNLPEQILVEWELTSAPGLPNPRTRNRSV
jgi:hypothetical protein